MKIVSVKHKGLKKFLETGDTKGIRPEDGPRIIETVVELIGVPQAMLAISLRCHELKEGSSKRTTRQLRKLKKFAVRINGAWRLTFLRDSEDNIVDLDYVQYH